MDGMEWNGDIGRPGRAHLAGTRGRPRRPMAAVLVILALTCSAIYAADRAGPLLAGIADAPAASRPRAHAPSP